MDPACCASYALGEPPPTTPSPGAHSSRRIPRNWYVCVPWPSMPSLPVTQPCVHPRGLAHNPQAVSQWTDVTFSVRLCSACRACLSTQMPARTYPVYAVIPFWKLEASNWDDSAEQKKWFRVITIDVFFLGRKCWLSVLSECAMRNSQRVPLTIRNFQRMFRPSKGQLF